MANGVFNIAKGRAAELWNNVKTDDPTAAVLRVFLMKANEAESTLIDRDTISAVFAEAGSTEADFTNYTNKSIATAALSAISLGTDDTNDLQDADIPDQTWTSAGGASNNTLTKLIVAYDPDGTDTDTGTIPLTHHDFAITTNGGDLTAQINTEGFFRAS